MLDMENLWFIKIRLIETLPKVVLGSEESLALAHAQQLLVILYYAGPQLVVDQLLHSPVCITFCCGFGNFFREYNAYVCSVRDHPLIPTGFVLNELHGLCFLK